MKNFKIQKFRELKLFLVFSILLYFSKLLYFSNLLDFSRFVFIWQICQILPKIPSCEKLNCSPRKLFHHKLKRTANNINDNMPRNISRILGTGPTSQTSDATMRPEVLHVAS